MKNYFKSWDSIIPRYQFTKKPAPEFDMQEQMEKRQRILDGFYKASAAAKKNNNRCLLCGEEVPIFPVVCDDCKRVFAAFKSILVAEDTEK